MDIQNKIFAKLLVGDGLRYSEIRIRNIENDLFNYHLQHLVKKGYINKIDNKYYLSDLGKFYIRNENAIDALLKKVDSFKMNVLCLVVREENGNMYIISHKRKRYPMYGDEGISGGPVNRGELILDAAKRNLKRKFGLTADFKEVLGTLRVVHKYKDQIFQDIIFQICYTNKVEGVLQTSNIFGENKWISLDEAIKQESNSSYPFESLINLFNKMKIVPINQIGYFFAEEEIKLEKL